LFYRGLEIDGLVNTNFAYNIVPNTPPLTSKESEIIQKSKSITGLVNENKR